MAKQYYCRNVKCQKPLTVPKSPPQKRIPLQETRLPTKTIRVKCSCGTVNLIEVPDV